MMGKLQKKIEEEFKKAHDLCYVGEFGPSNRAECAGVIEVGLKPNVLEVVEEMRQDFVSMFVEGKYKSDWERAKANQEWFERWLK